MSLLIIDGSKHAPVFEYKPPPLFRTTLEKMRWLDKERQYWIEGWNHLTGTHYHQLTQQKIKDRITGKIIRPEGREGDMQIHEQCRDSRKANRNTGVIKGRGLGLSTIGGSMANCYSITNPGINSIITSKDNHAINQLFMQKILATFLTYDKDLVGEPKKSGAKKYTGHQPIYEVARNVTKAQSYLRINVDYVDDGRELSSESQIFCAETSANEMQANAFSGMGAYFGFYDELPLHKRKKALLSSSIECFRDPATKKLTGHLLWGGTVEDTVSDEMLIEFKKLVENKELWDVDLLFMPFWWTMFLENGRPNEKLAMEWWDSEMEKYKHDEGAARAFRKNNPRSMDDVFDLVSTNAFEPDVAQSIKVQTDEVIKQNIPLNPVIISGSTNEAKIVEGSKTKILEPPRPGVKYAALVDSVGTGTEFGAVEGSEYAAIIIKLYDPNGGSYSPVAYYLERPNTIEGAYWNTVRLCEHYEVKSGVPFDGIMAEGSLGTNEHFTNFLINNGFGRYIMLSRDLSGKGNTNTKKAFQVVNQHTIDFQYRQANVFLRKHIANIKLLPLLQDLQKSYEENADMRSAWLMLFCAYPDINKAESIATAAPRRISVIMVDPVTGRRERKAITKTFGDTKVRAGQRLRFGL